MAYFQGQWNKPQAPRASHGRPARLGQAGTRKAVAVGIAALTVSSGILAGSLAASSGAAPPAGRSGGPALELAQHDPFSTTTTLPGSTTTTAPTTATTVATTTTTTAAVPPGMTTVTAARSAALQNMEGVNIHSSYGSTPYGNFPRTESLLVNLGIEHVRDPLAYNPAFVRSDQYNFYNELKSKGIGVEVVVSPNTSSADLIGRLNAVATYFPNAVDAIEAPNEANMIPGLTDWAAQDAAYVKVMDTLAKANPALRNVTVLGPSLANFLALRNNDQGFLALGNLGSSLDAGNVHLYPGGRLPSWNMDVTKAGEGLVAPNKPLWVTEAGYHDAVSTPGNFSASDAAIATYLPRLFLEWFQRGASRVNIYQLYDQISDPGNSNYQAHFGLVDNAGNPKPQYYAIQNMNRLLADTGGAFTPGSLTYSISSGSTKVSSVLLEKSDGQYQLFLWQDASVSNTATVPPTPVAAPSTPVTVTFQSPVASIDEFRPSLSGAVQASASNTSSFTFNLQGDATALAIQP
jgi:serralysin